MSACKRDISAEINLSMKELHLPGMRESYRECLQIANKDGQSYELFLLNLLIREQETRQINRVTRLLKQLRLPLEKSLATFFKDPMVTAAVIARLVHHSVIIELNIESYRMEEARKCSKKSSK